MAEEADDHRGQTNRFLDPGCGARAHVRALVRNTLQALLAGVKDADLETPTIARCVVSGVLTDGGLNAVPPGFGFAFGVVFILLASVCVWFPGLYSRIHEINRALYYQRRRPPRPLRTWQRLAAAVLYATIGTFCVIHFGQRL